MEARCFICGKPTIVGEPVVPEGSKGHVHITCANRQALEWRKRKQLLAMFHIFEIISSVLIVWILFGPRWALGVGFIGFLSHLYLQALWWQQMINALRHEWNYGRLNRHRRALRRWIRPRSK